jgi:EAL and modified HD-GYP domain-containing signal transduction protein
VSACQKLKSLGYKLALDNFVDEEAYGPLIGLADIIKLDYQRTPMAVQSLLIRKYRTATFLAMKVETTEDFKRAERLGYGLFQGYFFNKPVMISIKEIGTLQNNMVQITQKLAGPEPDLKAITSIIEKDMELSYKLLRIANSVYYHSLVPITSIQHALVQIGLVELRRWAHLLLIKGLSNTDNAELVKASLIRGKMLALFAAATKKTHDEPDYFIAGIFSSIDSLLDESMDKILSRLPLTALVKAALFGTPGPLRDALDAVLAFEKAQWEDVDAFLKASGLPGSAFMPMYIRALKWQQSLDI